MAIKQYLVEPQILTSLRAGETLYLYLVGSEVLVSASDESKTHLFLIYFSSMFLTVSDLFLCQIMEYSPTLCFVGVN